MERRIVTEKAGKIREIARNAAKGNWWRLFLGVLIFMAVFIVAGMVMGVFAEALPLWRYFIAGGYYWSLNVTSLLTIPLLYLVAAPLTLGLASFFIKAFREKDVFYGYVFSGFRHIGKAFLMMILIGLRFMGWYLLGMVPVIGLSAMLDITSPLLILPLIIAAVIPVVIALLRYSMALFILADHPEYKAGQCIRESKNLMKGNKGRLFCLFMSYFGWIALWYLFIIILVVIMGIGIGISSIAVMAGGTGAGSMIVTTLAMFIMIPVIYLSIIPLLTYIYMGFTAFYELVSGNLIVVGESEAAALPETAKQAACITGPACEPAGEPEPERDVKNSVSTSRQRFKGRTR